MIYTAVSERICGVPIPNWMANVTQYNAYRGHFGAGGNPITYYTDDELPFCVIVYTDVRLTGWFEDHCKRLIRPALVAIKSLQY